MQHIDKSAHREEGNSITLRYLESIKIEDEQRYPVDYNNSFRFLPNKENSYYKQMVNVLLMNQRNYCCYCMRRLTGDGDTTLEHIIPQSSDNNRIRYYQRDEVPELKNQIVLSSDFSHETNPPLDKLPHTVAYYNLVASCHGELPKRKHTDEATTKKGQCCNNARKEHDVFPIFLLDLPHILTYHKSGLVLEDNETQWNEDVRRVIINTKLNYESLRDIRQLWFVLKENSIEDIYRLGRKKETRLDLIQDALYKTSLVQKEIDNLLTKFQKEEYWNTFLLYDWFHTVVWDET